MKLAQVEPASARPGWVQKNDYNSCMTSRWFFALRQWTRTALVCALVSVAVACGRPDSSLEQAVRTQLEKDPMTAPLELSVAVRRGIVHLSGETRTRAEQARVLEIVRSLEGVKDVTNAMRISDGPLVEAVRKALAEDPMLASVPIDVDSRNGYVRLMSDQTSRDQRERAMAIARKVDGVREVEDRMK
jgi:hyperosmotically inducible protein